ncbi:MAG: gliding motility-associated-like protein [Flavobacteriaceae bacterium]
MEGKDNIKELFSEKLGNYEAQVNPEMWAKVATQIGASSAAVSTGVSLLTKWLIGIGVSAAAVTTAVIVMNSSDVVEDTPIAETTVQKQEQVVEENTEESALQTNLDVELTNDNIIGATPGIQEPILLPEITTPIGPTLPAIVYTDPDVRVIVTPNVVDIIVDPDIPLAISTTPAEPKKEPRVDPNIEPSIPVVTEPTFTIAQYTNVFSPNGDRTNDEFYLEIDGVKDFYMIVINNRGEAVYKSDQANFRWNGRDFRDEPVPTGDYVYMISGRDKDGNPIAQTKSLTIAR